jgi:hypothetical protein
MVKKVLFETVVHVLKLFHNAMLQTYTNNPDKHPRF